MDAGAVAPLLLHAAHFAAGRHEGQRRKDAAATPYINHPLALAHLLAHEAGISDPVVLAAALLHDTVEDKHATRAELEREFGADVAGVVMEVTDDTALPREVRKLLQVENAQRKSVRAKLVKLADKTCNLREIVQTPPIDWSLAHKQGYFDHARAVVDGMRGVHGTLERLFDEAWSKRPR